MHITFRTILSKDARGQTCQLLQMELPSLRTGAVREGLQQIGDQVGQVAET